MKIETRGHKGRVAEPKAAVMHLSQMKRLSLKPMQKCKREDSRRNPQRVMRQCQDDAGATKGLPGATMKIEAHRK